jgi:hypothetical protein
LELSALLSFHSPEGALSTYMKVVAYIKKSGKRKNNEEMFCGVMMTA